MSWAQKRKLIYIGSAVLVFLLAVVLPLSIHFYQAPTCFDGKQNQTELGVDCGGPCALLCPGGYVPLNVLWSRFSKVSDGVYNVLAYVENPNLNAGANNLSYTFKLYDKDGILLNERDGLTFAPADRLIAVFAADLQTGKQIPQRVSFSFTSPAVWQKQVSPETGLSVSQSVVTKEDSSPRLSAVLSNTTINNIKNIEAVAIIYNADGNALAFSRTIVDSIAGQSSVNLNFNWPQPFSVASARTEIILKVLK